MMNGPDGPGLAEAWLWLLTHDDSAQSIAHFLGNCAPGTYPAPVSSGVEAEVRCPLCLSAPARVKPDRNGKRFLQCDHCTTRFYLVDERYWDLVDRVMAFIDQNGPWLSERLATALGWVTFGKGAADEDGE